MVIQRWQSVLLLVVTALMAAFTFMSLGQLQTADFSYNITTMGLYYEGEATGGAPTGCYMHTWYFFTLSLLSALVSLISIFLYKKTRLQKRMCLINIMFMIALYAVGAGVGYAMVPGATVGWSTLIIAPLLGIAATVMAYNRISSDERKLRSADRIR